MLHSTAESLDEALLAPLLAELGREANRHRFAVAPNPCVGAAVLSAGQVVARGVHEVYGHDHAELQALSAAEKSDISRADWDLLVVTLEPCSSSGKTGPCVEAILASGIPRVVVGELDPDKRHQGAGLEALRDAGIKVYLMDGHVSLHEISRHFLQWNLPERVRRPRPWTIAKWAQTRTGQLQPPADIGEGRWISCDDSQREVHQLRGRVDAIVTGVDTVLADDPRLSIRKPVVAAKAPMRVILDSYLRTPPTARLLMDPVQGEMAGELVILTLAGADAGRWRALEAAGARVQGMHTEDSEHVSLREVQSWLWEEGARRMLLETGPTLLQAYFERQYVDQVRIYTGDVNGGRGTSMGTWLSTTKIEERLDREVDSDAVLEGFLVPS
jgi:diaminohydroxyphosphoribosylaminopyrimidine deaminase/5-amino-6-(5-phosphoribosylamino)uracil reductase